MNVIVSETWKQAWPGASVGILAMTGPAGTARHAGLDAKKKAIEAELRSRFHGCDRAALRALPVLAAYHAYYKRYKKSYHVQHQLESIVTRNRSIPGGIALVEAMFMAELKNQLLTAGHDRAALRGGVGIHAAEGTEQYVRMDGTTQRLKPGDMMIADETGVISCILYGPDRRTRIVSETRDALFTVYAPAGIAADAVRAHLHDIAGYVRIFSPEAAVETLAVHEAGTGS